MRHSLGVVILVSVGPFSTLCSLLNTLLSLVLANRLLRIPFTAGDFNFFPLYLSSLHGWVFVGFYKREFCSNFSKSGECFLPGFL